MGRTARIVFTMETGDVFNFEIDAAESIENVKALVEVEVSYHSFHSLLVTCHFCINNHNYSFKHLSHLNTLAMSQCVFIYVLCRVKSYWQINYYFSMALNYTITKRMSSSQTPPSAILLPYLICYPYPLLTLF